MSIRDGLPYGWWKNSDFWAAGITALVFAAMMVILLGAWFWGWGR